MKESELERVLASPNSETLDQLCDLLLTKLTEKQKGCLLPKQNVGGVSKMADCDLAKETC